MTGTFSLRLFDAAHTEQFDDVASFVGEDASGCFGLLPGHARFMTTLVFGLSRFRTGRDEWHYLAVPGAVLYFESNTLTVSTRHFLIDDDYDRISSLLQRQLLAEEENLRAMKECLQGMEHEMIKQLWKIRNLKAMER
ncbi:MAG: F0F1 ATP synthase subunit epsilon [Gammaproteobacteria bacterium]